MPNIIAICTDSLNNLIGLDVNGDVWCWAVGTKTWAPYQGPK